MEWEDKERSFSFRCGRKVTPDNCSRENPDSLVGTDNPIHIVQPCLLLDHFVDAKWLFVTPCFHLCFKMTWCDPWVWPNMPYRLCDIDRPMKDAENACPHFVKMQSLNHTPGRLETYKRSNSNEDKQAWLSTVEVQIVIIVRLEFRCPSWTVWYTRHCSMQYWYMESYTVYMYFMLAHCALCITPTHDGYIIS